MYTDGNYLGLLYNYDAGTGGWDLAAVTNQEILEAPENPGNWLPDYPYGELDPCLDGYAFVYTPDCPNLGFY